MVAQLSNPQVLIEGDEHLRIRRAHHELRSPTSLLITVARQALEERDLDDALAALELIERVASRTLTRVNAVLDEPAGPDGLAPADFLRGLVADVRRCGWRVDLTVAPAAEGARPAHDPRAFEALAQNLLENAQVHGDPAHPIHLELSLCGQELVFSVENSPAEVDQHRGFGLGGPLAAHLAARMRGRITTLASVERFRVALTVPTVS
ncbi:MAG: HAMP domain-containing histidine kinase [Dehalococcoidia bacterium]|nr:HAMP domain-containing histidine kinase [Dehalococcoidia bacterium]